MKFTKTFRTQVKVKDLIIVHLQLLIKTRPEVEEVIDVFKNYIKDVKYKYDKEQANFEWDVTPINNTTEVIDKITKVMALDIVTGVVQFIEGVRPETTPKPVGSFKRAGHLTDQILKYRHTKMAIHTVIQFYGDNKQLSIFSDEKIEVFSGATGLNLTNRPTNYGVALNQTQSRVFEGILKAFTDTNYKGDEQKNKDIAFKDVYSLTETSAKTLIKGDNAPYKNIETIPVVKLTQAQVIDLSGYDLKAQKQSDKQHIMEALSFLATNQFCFYWIRLKTDNGKPVKDKSGDYVKEEVMEVGTLLRIKTVRDQTGILQYYEIQPSAPLLDQVNNYFLLVPNNWRDEVKQITGKRASSYTYELLLWLRLQYEQIRRYNKGGGKNRKPKPFKINKSWEDMAIALRMPETMYKRNRPRSYKIIQEAYSVAIKLGYLVKVENNGALDILYLNERYYPKPGELM